jgi:glycerol transport system ATP-binding protein
MVVNGMTHIYNTDLTLKEGTMNVLLGRTQSGKTTLMRIMAGLDIPTTGSIFWNGKDVTKARVQDRNVAMVYQQFINYPSLSVYENIASPLKIMKMSKSEIDEKVKKTAELLHLSNQLDKKPLELSGGQQQRCALARALVKNSGLVLLDEPLANLDYKLREELREEIPKIFKESGAIFVYATTEPEEALLLGGNVATLWEGRITQYGKSDEVYHFPNSTTTARIFSNPSMNFFDFTKEGDYISFGDNEKAIASNTLKDLKDGKYIAGFRPNYLDIEKYSNDAMKIKAHLNVTEITGSETYLHLSHKNNHWIGLVEGVKKLKFNSDIEVYLDTRHIYVFSPDGKVVTSALSSIENYKKEES